MIFTMNLLKVFFYINNKIQNFNFFVDEKMLLRLCIKCIERILNNYNLKDTESFNAFNVLLELYKFYKQHPPENLEVYLENIKKNFFKKILKC